MMYDMIVKGGLTNPNEMQASMPDAYIIEENNEQQKKQNEALETVFPSFEHHSEYGDAIPAKENEIEEKTVIIIEL